MYISLCIHNKDGGVKYPDVVNNLIMRNILVGDLKIHVVDKCDIRSG